jgi:glycosyltransferase involved in cell wall biosynthesis
MTGPNPLVSIITPTFGREAFLPAIADCVRAQTYPNIEWLVFDDSERPCPNLEFAEAKLRYVYSPQRLSVGEKRNRLLEIANGEVVIHFDDDDYYGPHYVARALSFLNAKKLDLALLTGFFAAHLDASVFGYYRTMIKKGPGYAFNKNGVRPVDLGGLNIPFIHLCYGWTYVYRKAVWENVRFKDVSIFEDRDFIGMASRQFKVGAYESRSLDCVHSIHRRSSSQCFPQFLIPHFVVRELSPKAYEHVMRLKNIGESAALGKQSAHAEPASAVAATIEDGVGDLDGASEQAPLQPLEVAREER